LHMNIVQALFFVTGVVYDLEHRRKDPSLWFGVSVIHSKCITCVKVSYLNHNL